MICQDKKNLAERHCCVCEMSKLADLLKEHDEGIVLKQHDSEGNLEQTLRISADRLTLENVSGEKLTIYQGDALEELADMLGRR